MSSYRRIMRHVCLAGVLAAGFLLGCGSGEHNPSPARQGQAAPPVEDLAFKDPNDLATVSIDVTTSMEYDAVANEGLIYAVVRDQEGSFLPFFNEHNFLVTLQPGTAPQLVPAADTSLGITVSTDRVVALVIDSSGSMSATTETGQTRIQVAKEAAKSFIALMRPGDRTAVVDFDSDARVVRQLTDDQDALNRAIDTFSADGATNLGAALTEAVRSVGTRPGLRAAILLTDGDDTVDTVVGGPDVWLNDTASSRLQGLQLARDNGLVVYTVGLGDGLSETGIADLETIAAETGGTYFPAPTAAALDTAFSTTIPAELDALPPVQTYLLTFPNPFPVRPGVPTDIRVRLNVTYQNGVGILQSKFDGTYTVE